MFFYFFMSFFFSVNHCVFIYLAQCIFILSVFYSMFILLLLLYKPSLSFSYSINHSFFHCFILWRILFSFYLCPSKDSSCFSIADVYFFFLFWLRGFPSEFHFFFIFYFYFVPSFLNPQLIVDFLLFSSFLFLVTFWAFHQLILSIFSLHFQLRHMLWL